MPSPPKEMSLNLSDQEALSVEKWWHGLNPSKQQELERLYDTDKHHAVTVRFCARHVGEQEEPSEDEVIVEELTDLYEYLVAHEIWDMTHGFHMGGTCQRDPIAKTIVESGVLKKEFTCPLNLEDCQMRALMKYFPEQDVQLLVVFKRVSC